MYYILYVWLSLGWPYLQKQLTQTPSTARFTECLLGPPPTGWSWRPGEGGGRFMADSGCQWCPTSTHPSARWAGTCDSHLDTSQNDGLGGCRGNPEEISHAEWGGPRDLHDCVQEPLGSGKQVHLLTSFMSNLLLYPPLDMPITTGFLSCVSLHLSTLSYFPYNGWQTASVRVCMCVCFTDPDFGS